MQYALIGNHEVPKRPPLKVYRGESVMVGDRDEQWPEFVFVTSADGAGWVPARHIAIDSNAGTVRVDYDTTELPANVGDVVELVCDDQQSGWAWCRNAEGKEGWLPRRVLAPIDAEADI